MPAKAKIKVVTEEIQDAPEEVAESKDTLTETPKSEEEQESPAVELTPTADTTKLTSFSTLDAEVPMQPEELPTPDSAPAVEAEPAAEELELPKEVNSDDIKAWLTDVRPDTSKEMEKGGKSGFKIFLIIFLLLVAVGLAAGGVYYYKNNTGEQPGETQSENTETPPAETATPEPTKASVDLKKFTVNVLNGSGVTGEAKKVSDLLVADGFSEAKTGNASNSNFTKTEVSMKESVEESVFETIKESLGDTYDVEKAEKALNDSSSYDIVVTVGDKKS